MTMMKIMSPAGMLGTGFPEQSLEMGLAEDPDFIGVDAGSTDSGPHSLGSGEPVHDVKRDLLLLLQGVSNTNIPLLIGSAGTAGADPHLEAIFQTLTNISENQGFHFNVALIHSELSSDYLREKLADGKISALSSNVSEMSEGLIDRAEHIVGVMGKDPFIETIENGADVVIAGRSCDSAIFSSLAVKEGYPEGLSWHLGKTLECGNSCVEHRPHQDCMMGYLHEDHFVVKPLNPNQRCTPGSVSAHTLYENSNPYRFRVPTGELITSGCEYLQEDDRSVRVTGSQFESADEITIKIEAAEMTGYQAYHFGGMRDPLLVHGIDAFLAEVEGDIESRVSETKENISNQDYTVDFFVYGRNGCMGEWESVDGTGHELGFVIQVIGKTQEIATEIASMTRFDILHKGVPGWEGSVTNIASPLTPPIIEHGAHYQFSMNHTVEVDIPGEPFSTEYIEV